jgi:glycosyltransferase involved in cell wall biosynthesis
MKILVNLLTLHEEYIFPCWLRIFKKFQSFGCEVYINTGPFIKNIGPIDDFYNHKWLDEKEKQLISKGETKTKAGFMLQALRRNWISIWGNSEVLKKENFDVIYMPSAVLDFVLFPYFFKITGQKIKWAVTLANVVPVTDPGNKITRFLAWLFFKISLFMIRKADLVFASTADLERYLLKKGFKKEQVVRTNFAIENDLIEKAVKNEKYKIDALFTGRINETKGIFDMLKVLEIVKKKYPNFQLAIMGDGDEKTKKEFRKKISEMGLKNNVQFLGFIRGKEKFDIIKSAKCFWFFSVSESESFGIALLEAVCSGLTAFTYDLAPFRNIYKNQEITISNKGDYKAVAQKVLELFEKGDFENEKGKLLLGRYSWEEIAEKEYNAIEKLF